MDPITHGLAGVVLSRTGFYQRFGRPATIIFIVAALIPDIDHLTLRLAGPLAYLKYHRGFTHSIVGSFVIAAIMAGIVCSIERFREKLGYLRTIAIESAKAEAQKLGITGKRVEAIPLPFSPFRWSVYIEDDKRFYQVDVDALKSISPFNSFEKKHVPEGLNQGPEGNNIMEKVEKLEIVKTYLWFARFPVVTVKEEGEGYMVEYFDLRFNSLPPRRPFLLKLILDKSGSLNHAELMFHTIK